MKSIGIFDSGIGGIRFETDLLEVHPEYKTLVVHDRDNLPYGEKTPHGIQRLTDEAIQPILNYDVIVLACNTATAYAIDYLRNKYPRQTFVGFEPAIKSAATETKSNVVAVFATPATLKSKRFKKLKSSFGKQISIIEPDLALLAHQIENESVDWDYLQKIIEEMQSKSVDCIVLGCTHYHLLENHLHDLLSGSIKIITPTQAVIRQIEKL